MKTKLLFTFYFFTLFCAAQAPITSYYPVNGAVYKVVSSSSPLDHSPSGANAIWNFTTLAQIGTSTDSNLTPTGDELTTYPNTTTNTVTTTTVGITVSESKIYSKDIAGEISITGLFNPQIELNFATDNALVGTFPLNYGYSNTDNIAGTFTSGTFSGGVAGTINASVDAYGTLTLNIDGAGETSYQVTRLKSIQHITMSYGIFGNIGTIDQTLYYYYINGVPNSPIFRTSSTLVNVPLQGINNQTYLQLEKYDIPLGVTQSSNSLTSLTLFPNPTQDKLNIIAEHIAIQQITISDMSGRIVLHKVGAVETLSLGDLQKGIYNATIVTASGTKTQKIIKN